MTGVPSPNQNATGPMTYTVSVDRQPIDDATSLLSIETWSAVNGVPKARLEIRDGDPVRQDFPIASGFGFEPGGRLTIGAGYSGGGTASLFDGVITKVGIEASSDVAHRFIVEAADEALKMTLEPKTEVHEAITDRDLIARLLSRNGLEMSISPTTGSQAKVRQDSVSDWDLMLARAVANGLSVIVEAGRVTVARPDPKSPPDLTVTYGNDLMGLRLDRDASSKLFAGPNEGPATTRGHVRFQGTGLASTGRTIALAGLGRQFSGTALITGVRHSIQADTGWITTTDLSF